MVRANLGPGRGHSRRWPGCVRSGRGPEELKSSAAEIERFAAPRVSIAPAVIDPRPARLRIVRRISRAGRAPPSTEAAGNRGTRRHGRPGRAVENRRRTGSGSGGRAADGRRPSSRCIGNPRDCPNPSVLSAIVRPVHPDWASRTGRSIRLPARDAPSRATKHASRADQRSSASRAPSRPAPTRWSARPGPRTSNSARLWMRIGPGTRKVVAPVGYSRNRSGTDGKVH